MINLSSIIDLWSTPYGKAVHSIVVGTVGTVILVAFFNMVMLPAYSLKFISLIIAFNAALTGYMVLEKTRETFRRKWSVSMVSGTVMTLLAFIVLNAFFLQTTSLYMLGLSQLAMMLVMGIGASWFGGVLAINYFKLN